MSEKRDERQETDEKAIEDAAGARLEEAVVQVRDAVMHARALEMMSTRGGLTSRLLDAARELRNLTEHIEARSSRH
jgi:hypothetical protein